MSLVRAIQSDLALLQPEPHRVDGLWDPNLDDSCKYLLAECLVSQGKLSEAERVYLKLLRYHPTSPDAVQLGGNGDELAGYFEGSTSQNVPADLAILYIKMGRVGDAITWYHRSFQQYIQQTRSSDDTIREPVPLLETFDESKPASIDLTRLEASCNVAAAIYANHGCLSKWHADRALKASPSWDVAAYYSATLGVATWTHPESTLPKLKALSQTSHNLFVLDAIRQWMSGNSYPKASINMLEVRAKDPILIAEMHRTWKEGKKQLDAKAKAQDQAKAIGG